MKLLRKDLGERYEFRLSYEEIRAEASTWISAGIGMTRFVR